MRESFVAVHYETERPESGLVLTADFQELDGRWIAECLELGTPAYADSLADARSELWEAIELQLNEVSEMGFLDEFLRQHNVTYFPIRPPKSGSSWIAPQFARTK